MTSQLLLDFASEVTVVQYTSREFGAPNVYKQTVQGRTRIKKGGKKGRLFKWGKRPSRICTRQKHRPG